MNKARKLLRLSLSDLIILDKLTLLFILIRVGLVLLPFRHLRSILSRVARTLPHPQRADEKQVKRIVRMAKAISPYLLGDKPCLTNALAVQFLLVRRGYPSVLRIGVAKRESSVLEAHAWLEHEGKILMGGTDSPQRFTPLPPIAQESR
jgi:hypothetical protein